MALESLEEGDDVLAGLVEDLFESLATPVNKKLRMGGRLLFYQYAKRWTLTESKYSFV
jgi:hypothetical protein